MSTKADKFKNLMRSPSTTPENKEDIIKSDAPSTIAHEIVQLVGKKKATFELDPELHRWLKLHSLTVNKMMVEIVEELIRRYRSEVEGR